jgi:hypothetical protein
MPSERNQRDDRLRWRSPMALGALASLLRLVYEIVRDWHRL